MPKIQVLVLVSAFLGGCDGGQTVKQASRTAQVRPGVLEWKVGIGQKDGPSSLVEVILPATYNGRAVWRVVHWDGDPTASGSSADYDMYDVDRVTVRPVRSVASHDGFYLALTFDSEKVMIERRDQSGSRRSEVSVRDPMPEGPGLEVLLASLSLRVGYRTSFSIVDRWDETRSLKQIDLVVGARQTIQTPLGRCDVLEVTIAARDGSFSIRDWVWRQPPHYPLRMEYVRGAEVLRSEVVRMVVTDAPVSCVRAP
jgi:hypothetical protein